MRIEKNTRNFWLGNLFVEISKISVGYISVMMMEVFNGGELLKMFWKGFLDFFPERRGWALRIFSNIFVEKACEKARDDKEDGIDGYWSIYIGKYRWQDIVTYDKRLMDVFFMHLCSSCFSKASLSSHRTNTRFFAIFILSGRIEKKWRYCIFLQWWYNTRKTF